MASILSTLLGGWAKADDACLVRRLAALEEGEIVCSEYGALLCPVRMVVLLGQRPPRARCSRRREEGAPRVLDARIVYLPICRFVADTGAKR